MNPRGISPTSIARHHEHDATTAPGDCKPPGVTLEFGTETISLTASIASSANLGNLALLHVYYDSGISFTQKPHGTQTHYHATHRDGEFGESLRAPFKI